MPAFIAAQILGGLVGYGLLKLLYPTVILTDERRRSVASSRSLEGRRMTDRPVVLFLCTHNAGRSLAAKVLLDHYAKDRVEVRSAGSEPADELNPP